MFGGTVLMMIMMPFRPASDGHDAVLGQLQTLFVIVGRRPRRGLLLHQRRMSAVGRLHRRHDDG